MNYNYHTHTYRCHHASGTEEEYILKAIEGGIKYMGFADHIPQIFPDGYESSYRVPMAEAENYFETIKALREKYADKIDIKIGFETEYYPLYFDKMTEAMIKLGCEYFICGQHFIHNEHPGGVHTSKANESYDDLVEYTDCVTGAIESGIVSYIAHPDLFNFTGSEEQYTEQITRLCECAKKHNIPLEINFLGIRDHRRYPYDPFWKICGEVGAPVTYGFDAHDVPAACDKTSLAYAEELTQKYNLNYIGKPNLILL